MSIADIKAEAAGVPGRHSGRVIFARYVAFAIIAGVLNLATQAVTQWLLPHAFVAVAVLAGTAVGFGAKYILDKFWIFDDRTSEKRAELRKIVLYGASGVATTLIFWGVELSAWYLFRTVEAMYLGGALGLAIGNWLKYRLDKKLAFGSAR